jgi:hypothetical protein
MLLSSTFTIWPALTVSTVGSNPPMLADLIAAVSVARPLEPSHDQADGDATSDQRDQCERCEPERRDANAARRPDGRWRAGGARMPVSWQSERSETTTRGKVPLN